MEKIKANCENCPLSGSTQVQSYLPENVEILVLGQSPGVDEVKQGRPFVGRSGALINPVMEKYSKHIGYINAINCRPLDEAKRVDRQPATKEINACKPRFQDEITKALGKYKPKVVLVFGAVARKALKGISFNGTKVYNLDHPAYILRNRHMHNRFIREMHNSLVSVSGGASDVEDTFITYDKSMKSAFLDQVHDSKIIAVDTETNSINVFIDNFTIGTVQVACEKNVFFFDFRKKPIIPDVVVDILKDKSLTKLFANTLFDVVAFKKFGAETYNYRDVLPLAFLHNNTYHEYDLKTITMRYLPEYGGYEQGFEELGLENYLDAPTDVLKHYGCYDSFVTRKLYFKILGMCDKDRLMVYNKIIVPLLPALVSLKFNGMRVDLDLVDKYDKIYRARFDQIAKKFEKDHGVTNVNSHPQIRKLMFDKLKLTPIRYSKQTKLPSTDKDFLEANKNVQVCGLLREARRINPGITNYFLPVFREYTDSNGFIHPNIRHFNVQTGRLAYTVPPLQGIPRDETGIKILDENPLRRIFVTRSDDFSVVENDYSQQEVRIVAELSGDSKMKQAFEAGEDIHTFVAALVFNKPPGKVSKFERQVAKSCNFGTIFGISAKEMAIDLGITERKAQTYIDMHKQEFPTVARYIRITGERAYSNKEIKSVLGRPRKFISDGTRRSKEEIKREGANFTIQSTGADMTFLSLTKIYEKFNEIGILGKDVFIIHTVHDSIMLNVRNSLVKEVAMASKRIMESIPKQLGFKVPFVVDTKVGKRWGEGVENEF